MSTYTRVISPAKAQIKDLKNKFLKTMWKWSPAKQSYVKRILSPNTKPVKHTSKKMIINPLTGRKIKKGGLVHKKLKSLRVL